MSYSEMLKELIEENNGIIITKDAVAAGIPKVYLSEFVQEGKLERVGHGIYSSKNAFEDTMYFMQRRKEVIIYSHDTALFLHGLSDRDPLTYSVTVPKGYNTKNLRQEGITVFSVSRDIYDEGIVLLSTPFGRSVKAYDMDRTMCDLVRSRNYMDIAILTDGFKQYVKRSDKNIPRLMKYAERFRVVKYVRSYLEVLL